MTTHRPRLWPCLLVPFLISGCMFRQLERNLAEKRQHAVLRGEVRTEHPTDLPIVVFVYASEDGSEQLVEYFVLAGPGPGPVVAPSWYDMAPGSPFLRSLLEPELPPTLTFDLLFSYSGRSRLMVRGANDGVVTLASQLDLRAQAQAGRVRGFDETHTSILRSADVAAMVNEQLAVLAAE